MSIRHLNRYQASGWHFLLSGILAVGIFLLFRLVWYPGALFELAGAGTLMLIVVGIDVTIGPLLTLLVFNPRKKELVWDLTIIAVVQAAALGYGLWVTLQSRPVFLVAAVDRLVLVSANEISPEDLLDADDDRFKRLSYAGPVLVGAKRPESSDERFRITIEAAGGGADIDRRPKYYVEINQVSETLASRALNIESIKQHEPESARRIQNYLHRQNIRPDEVYLLPLQARKGFGTAILDRETLSLIASMPLDPLQ